MQSERLHSPATRDSSVVRNLVSPSSFRLERSCSRCAPGLPGLEFSELTLSGCDEFPLPQLRRCISKPSAAIATEGRGPAALIPLQPAARTPHRRRIVTAPQRCGSTPQQRTRHPRRSWCSHPLRSERRPFRRAPPCPRSGHPQDTLASTLPRERSAADSAAALQAPADSPS
jgi:hypothetical protein